MIALKNTATTRRRFIAASGALAVGGLAGCLTQMAAATTNTGASPAALFGGLRGDHMIAITPGETVRLSPSVRIEAGFLDGEVALDGWVTNVGNYPTRDFSATRSNRETGLAVGDSDGDGPRDSDEEARKQVRASIERLQTLTGASDDDIRSMYTYLEEEPLLGESSVITLPDARAPRDGTTLETVITPDRLIQYVTGRANDDGSVYAWGSGQDAMAAADGNDDDEDDESCEQTGSGGGLSTEGHVYCWGDNSTTAISAPVHTYGSLAVLQSTAGVGIINTPPTATDEKSRIGVTSDGRPIDGASLDDWGRESGPAASTSIIVCQVLVQPADCPAPIPALLHVQRHKNNDQYIYSCGWVIDESCLYADSTTVLTTKHRGGAGSGGRVGVYNVPADVVTGLSGDEIRRMMPDDVSPIGSQLFDGSLRVAVRAGAMPDAELAEQVARTVSDSGDVQCVCRPFDGSYLHLVDDGDVSDTVKFKSGAELSKSVN